MILPVMCGVPQGSIPGSLLYILFINDINISKLTKFIYLLMTLTYFLYTNITKLYENVNIELTKISKWFKINKLTINIKKDKIYYIYK